MKAQKLYYHHLTQEQNFQLEQALAAEVGCNMSDVSFSFGICYVFVWFYIDGFHQCAMIDPKGEYWSFRESIRSSVKEAKKLAA